MTPPPVPAPMLDEARLQEIEQTLCEEELDELVLGVQVTALLAAYRAVCAERGAYKDALEYVAHFARDPVTMNLAATLHYDMAGAAQRVLDRFALTPPPGAPPQEGA